MPKKPCETSSFHRRRFLTYCAGAAAILVGDGKGSATSEGSGASGVDRAPSGMSGLSSQFLKIVDSVQEGELKRVPTVWPQDRGPRFDDFFSVDGEWRSEPNGWSERLLYDPVHKRAHFLGCRWTDLTLFTLDLATLKWQRLGEPDRIPGIHYRLEYRPFNRMYTANGYLWFMPQDKSGAYSKTRQLHRMPLAGPYRFEPIGPMYPSSQPPTPDFGACFIPGLGHIRSEIDTEFTGKILLWRNGSERWAEIGKLKSGGRSNTVFWNPIKKEALVFGGRGAGQTANTSKTVDRVLPNGKVEYLGEANTWYLSSSAMLTYDPLNGDYLLWQPGESLVRRSSDGIQWEIDADWRGANPFGEMERRQSWDAIPDLGVILLVDYRSGVHVYRPVRR